MVGGKPMVREDMLPTGFWKRRELWFMFVVQLLWFVVCSIFMVIVTKCLR